MKSTNKGKLFKKGMMLICTFFAMTLFLVDVKADSVKYSEFDWDTFYEQNKEFWLSGCVYSDNSDECEYRILKSQKKFYTKLYKSLAKLENNGILVYGSEDYDIVDDIIVETAFYEMSPSNFADDGLEYNDMYDTSSGIYNIDENDLDDPNIIDSEDDYKDESFQSYYANETDTVKTLVKNMVAYTTACYGIYGDATKITTESGEEYYDCGGSGEDMEINTRSGVKCVDTISTNGLGFWKYYSSKLQHDENLLGIVNIVSQVFLGRAVVDENYNACKVYDSSYPEGVTYTYEGNPHIDTDKYFDFLSNSTYFDKKAHLQYKYKEDILEPEGVDCMYSSTCDNSLEAKDSSLLDTYEGEAILIRQKMIADIIGILNDYGFDISYDPVTGDEYKSVDGETATRKSFYWPIGSDETEVRDGVTYADGDPASTEVIYQFGERVSPITGEIENHYGIDIKGIDGVTNVIAVYKGEVISVVDSCEVGDTSCNEGYGNTIILSHSNGDYTVYAHLSSIDSAVSVGTSVDKGQLIGKVGTTGATVEACLHYELRSGGLDISNAVDPIDSTDPSEPRPTVPSGDFPVHETSLTKEEFVSLLKSYCVSNSCSSTFMNVFVANAESVYTTSVNNDVNPELVIVRALKEGLSPGGSTNNYWGIGCTNEGGSSACYTYSSLSAGIKGFASVVSKYDTVVEMMGKYAYIGAVWFNPGSWSKGGCVYYPYIAKYMSEERSATVNKVCNSGPSCSSSSDANCTPTTSEDQTAYQTYNAEGMINLRYIIFGL